MTSELGSVASFRPIHMCSDGPTLGEKGKDGTVTMQAARALAELEFLADCRHMLPVLEIIVE